MALSPEQALDCLRSVDLIGLGMEADGVRRRLHPERVVSYVVEITLPVASDPQQALEGADRLGATGFVLLADGAATLRLADYELLLGRLLRTQPELGRHGLSATEVLRLAADEGLNAAAVLSRLQAAGLDSLGGEDAFLLDDAYRTQPDRALCSAAEWLAVHRTAHRQGMPSAAGMTFGLGEPHEVRAAHLDALDAMQRQTGGFVAFTLRAWTPRVPSPTHRTLDEATAVDYLKTLAVARLVLQSIPHLEADPAQGLKVTQMALRFGADDAGPVLTDEHALRLAGRTNCATEEELRRIIRDAGFSPVERDHLHRLHFLV